MNAHIQTERCMTPTPPVLEIAALIPEEARWVVDWANHCQESSIVSGVKALVGALVAFQERLDNAAKNYAAALAAETQAHAFYKSRADYDIGAMNELLNQETERAPTPPVPEIEKLIATWRAEDNPHEWGRHDKRACADQLAALLPALEQERALDRLGQDANNRQAEMIRRLHSETTLLAQAVADVVVERDEARRLIVIAGETLIRAEAQLTAAEQSQQALRTALEAADRFITNGIELGFIRMPDADCPDPAKAVPGMIRAALASVQGTTITTTNDDLARTGRPDVPPAPQHASSDTGKS